MEINTKGIKLFRTILCILSIKNVILYLPYCNEFYGKDAIIPYDIYQTYIDNIGNPLLEFPFYIDGAPFVFMIMLFALSIIYMLTGNSLSGLVLWWLLLIGRIRNPWISDGSDNVIAVMLPILCLCYTKTIIKTSVINTLNIICTTYLRIALMIQVSLIYFISFTYKMQGELWQNGTALYYIMRVNEFCAIPLNITLTQNHYFVIFATYFSLFFQICFAFLIWFRQTKWIVIFLGCIFHIGIWIFLKIDNFSWIMIATYAIFVTDKEFLNINNYLLLWKTKLANLWTMYDRLIKP
jgi:hypothetical protein